MRHHYLAYAEDGVVERAVDALLGQSPPDRPGRASGAVP
jgi:hypothetical protein